MRTFAQKPVSSSLARPKMATPGRDHRPHPILNLQRAIGNQAVQRMLQTHAEELKAGLTGTASPHFGHDFSRIPIHHPASGAIQTKLAINQPGDEYEQEADRVAEQVMWMSEPISQVLSHNSLPNIQRKCAECANGHGLCPKCAEEEKMVQRRSLASQITSLIQRQEAEAPEEEEEETFQAKEDAGRTPALTPSVESHINSMRGGGQPLPESVRAFFEPRFGYDFSQVRLHTGTHAAEMAQTINAKAFTLGRDIVFGSRQYAPETHVGRHLIAHELTHVIQQSRSGYRVQRQPVNRDDEMTNEGVNRDDEMTNEGIEAHRQIQNYFYPRLQAEVRVPRATKRAIFTKCTTSETEPGYLDLWRREGNMGYIGEIKPCTKDYDCSTGRVWALEDAEHYVRRLNQLIYRFLGGDPECREDMQPTSDDEEFDDSNLGGGLQERVPIYFNLLDRIVPTSITVIGRSWVGSNNRKILHCQRREAGVVIYWHNRNVSKKATKESRELFELEEKYAASLAGQVEAAATFVGVCVFHAIAGEFIEDPGFCGIILDTGLGLIPYIDQTFDVRDLVAHCYWILFQGQYDSPLRWLSLALTLIGLIPEGGTVIEGIGSLAKKALKEGPQAVEGILVDAIRKEVAREGLQKTAVTIQEAWPIMKKQGIELFLEELDKLKGTLDWLYKQIATANRFGAGYIYELFGGNSNDLIKLMEEIDALKLLLSKLKKDSPELLENGFDLGYKLFQQVA